MSEKEKGGGTGRANSSGRVRNSILSGALILSLGGILSKIIGAFYRIPLTNILGSEGMGLYQLVFPYYIFLLTISTTSLPAAISGLIGRHLKENREDLAERTFRVSMLSLTVIGAILSLAMFFGAPMLAGWLDAPELAGAFRAISPAILFVCVISALRGRFAGHSNMVPTAVSQVVEQLVKAGFCLFFARRFMPDVGRAVLYSILSVTISEAAALVYLFVRLWFAGRKTEKKVGTPAGERTALAVSEPEIVLAAPNPAIAVAAAGSSIDAAETALLSEPIERTTANDAKPDGRDSFAGRPEPSARRPETFWTIFRAIYAISIPVTVSALLMPLSQIIDGFLAMRIVGRYASGAVQYGLFSGPVCSLVSFPTVFAQSIGLALIPGISGKKNAQREIALSLKLTFFIAVPCTVFFILFAHPIVGTLYRGLSAAEIAEISDLLKVYSLSILGLSLMQTSVSILIARNRAKVCAYFMAIATVVKVVLSGVLMSVPSVNIFGAAISGTVCFLLAGMLDLYYIIKDKDIDFRFRSEYFLKPVFYSLAVAGVWLVTAFLPLGEFWKLMIAGVLLLAAYALFFFKGSLFAGERELMRRKHD